MKASRQSRVRTIVAVVAVLALAWVAACGVLYRVMQRPPEDFARFMTKIPAPVAFMVLPFESLWTRARSGSLQVGDQAPDFSLVKLDKTEQVRVSELTAQQRPVVLIFGSYT